MRVVFAKNREQDRKEMVGIKPQALFVLYQNHPSLSISEHQFNVS